MGTIRLFCAIAACGSVMLGSPGATPTAFASPESEIASAFDEGDAFDLHTSIQYRFSTHSATIRRERAAGSAPDGPVNIEDELLFSSTRHELVPRLELGVFTDLAISVELPIVLRDTRSMDLAGDRGSSSTISDGILPMNGFDARDPGGPGFTSGDTIFRGVDRAGLDQLIGGVTWAPMNQARDWTKPTWKLGAEMRLAIGKAAAFDRADPDSEKGVGRGLHEVRLWTSVARRRGWAEAFFEIAWMASFTAKQAGQLDAPAREFGAAVTQAQQQAAARAGIQAIFFEKKRDHQKVSLDLEANFVSHFEGREYGEMWEIFAFGGDVTTSGPLVLDSDPTVNGVQAVNHPGVTNIQNYTTIGTRASVRAELGSKVRVGSTFGFDFDQAHFISFADAGDDRPTCTGGRTTNCETEDNDVVDAGTVEVNPQHSEVIDLVGQRYQVAKSRRFWFMVEGRFLF